MKIVRITLGRTVNVGNYENVRFDLTADVDPDETPEQATKLLKKEVDAAEAKLRKEYTERNKL